MIKKEDSKKTNKSAEEDDAVTLIRQMQRQIMFLEKKIDLLVEQSGTARKSYGEKRFSKPFRPQRHSRNDIRKEGVSHLSERYSKKPRSFNQGGDNFEERSPRRKNERYTKKPQSFKPSSEGAEQTAAPRKKGTFRKKKRTR